MAEDETGTTSSPWGRSRRPPGRATPAPGATPPPSPPPAPSLDKTAPAPPAGPWAGPTPPPGAFGGDGTPPPGAPVGGYPPQGPVPVRTGGGGVVVALVAVAVVVLLVVGAGVVLLLTGGDGDDPDRTTARSDSTSEPAPTDSIDGGTGATTEPGATAAPAPTDSTAPTDPVPTDSLPPGGIDLSLPEGFPVPDGAAVGASGLLEVPGLDVAQVRDFFVAELPAAGYTVDDVSEVVEGSAVITVSGPDSGSLVILSLGAPTSLAWTPA